MTKTSDYAAGWMDLSIHDFLSTLEVPSSSITYALITCLDSSFEVASMLAKSPALQPLQRRSKIIGKGVLLTTRRLLEAKRRQRLFFGFDEVWFFDRRKVSPKPEQIVITGPAPITDEQVQRMSKWMHKNGCSLGLGDGTGMNFCARLHGVARDLIKGFMESIAAPESGQNGKAAGSVAPVQPSS
jgi:hypothetical protein